MSTLEAFLIFVFMTGVIWNMIIDGRSINKIEKRLDILEGLKKLDIIEGKEE